MYSDSRLELVRKIINGILPPKIDESSVSEIEDLVSDYMFDCKYSLDGKHLVIGSFPQAHVIDVETRTLNRSLKDHGGSVYSVAFSPDGQKLATCSSSWSIIIYNLQDFSILSTLNNDSSVGAVVFSNCSNYVYTGCGDGYLKKWDIHDGNVVLATEINASWICKVKLSCDGKHLLIGGGNKFAMLVNPDNFSLLHQFNHTNRVEAIDFHPTERIVATGDRSSEVKLWNMDDGSLIHTFNVGGEVYCINFLTPSVLLIMSGDGYITSYNVDSFEEIQKVHCGCDPYDFSFALSPDK
eukprot:TRINITY_DN3058_c1_g7_i1.p1 TRINITY_DN3058_c1_g7~~TRINITY_DN3058_c1_g7_i1.p1  ORF type:complete len:296 (-),score=52.22 TRINITY_DN3058_c1_g7_i1:14-901(-)